MLMDGLAIVRCPMPIGYGGWSQVLSDLTCLGPDTIKNMACDARREQKKVILSATQTQDRDTRSP